MRRKRKKQNVPEISAVTKKGVLVLRMRLHSPKLSNSRKTAIVASTRGFKRVGIQVFGGRELYVTANACVYPEPEELEGNTK